MIEPSPTTDPSPDTQRVAVPIEEKASAASGDPRAPRRWSRRRRAVIAAAGMVALGAALAGLVLGKEEQAPAATSGYAVPHVEEGAIVLPPGFRERARIAVTPAVRTALSPVVRVTGTVSFDPAHETAVGTRLRGFVRRLHKLEGDAVQAGDVLAEIESADLGEAQAAVATARAQRLAAERNATRERDLSAKKLTTARELEVAEAELSEQRALLGAAQQRVTAMGGSASGPYGVFVLRAPIAGTVVERHISPGQSVEEHLVAFRVVDLDHLWVELSVFERRLGGVKRGDRVAIRSLAEPDAEIAGKVAHVGDVIDQDTRSASVRVQIDNHARKLRPGQSVTAEIRSTAPAAAHVTVPVSAVTFVDGKPTVFVAVSPDRVLPRPVELGATDGTLQAVTSGVAEGDSVVSEGVFALKSELFR